jgi:antitoxin component YwqK of YwqJK toxin-antitoxin module
VAQAAPERPAGVPEGGFWNPSVGKWEVSQKSEQGAREGECLFYRSDGSLFSRFRFAADVQNGPFAIYHPDGKLARAGRFAAGQIEGIVSSYASAAPGNEPLRACCVPPTAVRLDGLYQDGQLVQEIFYDGEGRPILSDGRPWPPRPAGVPEDAEFDEAGARWARRRPDLERFWSAAGLLGEEIEYAGGARRAVRRFDGDGRIAESCEFAPDGRRHGAFSRRLPPDETSPYADGRIREERGTFDLGQAVGLWTFLDADGQVLRQVARGMPFADGGRSTSPAFSPQAGRPIGQRWTLARALVAEGKVRDGLCVAGRAAAADGDRATLEQFLATHILPLAPALAAQRGDALVQSTDATVSSILDGLICGADPASAFRALGAVLPGADPVAPDFVEASLLLAPERRMTHLTRALIRFQVGDEAGARADAAVVELESPEGAASLRTYLQAAFRPYEFWPAREALAPDPALADLPAGLARDLDEVHQVMAVFATRLARLRTAVQAMIGSDADPAWLPPEVSIMLPTGPVPLRRARVAVEVGEGQGNQGDGAEPDAVEINEEIETDGLGVPALLGAAQADWGALAWLCWSVGLGRVALPETLVEPPLFAVAMKMIVTRAWRAQDRLATGSLLARANDVPGFDWQGIDIDALPQHLARVVAEEYTSVRSMFLWLASPEVLSPFQRDLREA